MSEVKLGENHPRFGKSHTKETRKKLSQVRGLIIFVYSFQRADQDLCYRSEDQQLLETFTSSNAAAKHFICSDVTIMKYARSRNTLRNECVSSLAPLESRFEPIKNIYQPSRKGNIIFVYSLNKECLFTFSSSAAAANHFKCVKTTILKHARSSEIFQDQYILSLEILQQK